ncbi:MAG: tetratricopeptide repeat protein [Oligoflexia bacterium]|nr:tetratricopeptide repeat protein [Oligoflexia bacterium]
MRHSFYVILICCLLGGCFFRVWSSSYSSSDYEHLSKAEEYTRQAKYDEAITEYQQHIEFRLSRPRPEWENPHFYKLMIGDLQLQKGDAATALKSFEEAEKAGIDRALVADRYRSIASWHEKNGRYSEAIQVLQKYRDRDDLLFDAMMDRLARTLSKVEESPKKKAAATPTSTPR